VSDGVRRLEALVGQVLQFSREIAAQPQPTDLTQVLEQAVEFATARTPRASVRVLLEGEPHLRVVVDPLLMGQAVLNLLLNATEAIAAETRGTVPGGFTRPPPAS